jgi:hypothetical protein
MLRDDWFEDATASSGLGALPGGYGHGVAVGDYNSDGRPDLAVTRRRSHALYRNRGGGRFEDVKAPAALAGDRQWPTSAAFADLDGDGDLHLYVCHCLKWDEHDPRLREEAANSKAEYTWEPHDFPAQPDHIFRNDGGRFVDVTADAKLDALAGFVVHR